MGDTIDQAQETDALFGALALAARPRAMPPAESASPEFCRFCGDPIPLARRAAMLGVESCLPCQDDLERESRRCG